MRKYLCRIWILVFCACLLMGCDYIRDDEIDGTQTEDSGVITEDASANGSEASTETEADIDTEGESEEESDPFGSSDDTEAPTETGEGATGEVSDGTEAPAEPADTVLTEDLTETESDTGEEATGKPEADTDGEACEHERLTTEEAVVPTCTEDGLTDGIRCADCGKAVVAQAVIPASGHVWDEGVVTAEPTCTEPGERVFSCQYCRGTKVEEEAAPGHAYAEEWVIDREATCVDPGSKSHPCTVCSEQSDVTVIPPTEEHDYDENDRCTVCGAMMEYTDGLEFELSEDGLSYVVWGIGSVTESEIRIPRSYDDMPVTRIEEFAFQGCSFITDVRISGTVTSIGNKAFSGCIALVRVYINNSVTDIGEFAFSDCTNLLSVTIPDGVSVIGKGVFSGCSAMKTLTIPAHVVGIGDSAFYNCYNLEQVLFEENSLLQSIGNGAFSLCYDLTEIAIPDRVVRIGKHAFSNCDLSEMTFGENSMLSQIGVGAFADTNAIEVERGISYVNGWVVACDASVTSARLREGTRGIADGAFSGCDGLLSMTVPETVCFLGSDAVGGCEQLGEIQFEGTTEQWNAIVKAADWDGSLGTYTLRCLGDELIRV